MSQFRVLLYVLSALLCAGCSHDGGRNPEGDSAADPAYVGAAACADCHQEQVDLWRGSHHELAMQPASDLSVLGEFKDSRYSHNGVTSRFLTRDGEYFVETDGQDGQLDRFRVRYAFGVEPLQQYLLELPGGGIQALGVSWDSRPAGEGGQRWFHVYGDEVINHTDVLHWTRPGQNWDSMCAYCHSTGLKKAFDPEARTFNTTWAEINVACEACHGPASRHIEWAESGTGELVETYNGGTGLLPQLDERDGVRWIPDFNSGNSQRNRPRITQVEINTCGACHARRSQIEVMPMPGGELLDSFRPALIQPPLYHVDGQIRDEVYVYGSFLQSRMHQQGVTCSDCHEPHSLKLRAPGSEVCLQCHSAEKFATTGHHLHPPETAGADCIECHMPATTYMQVDRRHDHSFSIPRPDLSTVFATPNACTNCHDDKSAQWAVEVLGEQGKLKESGHWREKFAAIMGAKVGARALVPELLADKTVPAIVRASVIVQASMYGDASLTEGIVRQAADENPLMRWGVARSLQGMPVPIIVRYAVPLLNDRVRAIRIAAANALAPVAPELLPASVQSVFQSVLKESVEAELVNNERAEAHTNIGNLHRQLGYFAQSERAYQTALDLNELFVPAYVNLADLYREQKDESVSEALLREAIDVLPEQPALHYSLGMSLVRQGRENEARAELLLAAESADAGPRMAVAYALILDALGQTNAAIEYLNGSLQRFNSDPVLLSVLTNLYRRTNQREDAEQLNMQLQK